MRSTQVRLISVVSVLLMASSFLTGQELEEAWDDYLSADASLKGAVDREQQLQEQQSRLQTEIRDLQENRAWYNGWIIEYILSRKSIQQLELADSLLVVKGRVRSLQQRKESAFQVLKQVYEDILLTDTINNSLSTTQKEQAVALGRRLLARSESRIDLPDYSTILTEQYENTAIKEMVFSDLQIVLRTKLATLDTILAEKRQEIALLNRLNEFHRDLNIQIETNRDLQGERESNQAYAKEPGDWGTGPTGEFLDDEYAVVTRDATIEGQDYLGDINRSISESELDDISLNPDPLYDELQRLNIISQQYQDLLQRLGTELPD